MRVAHLPGRIRALRQLSVRELRRLYEVLAGRAVRTDNRDWLTRGVYGLLVRGQPIEGRNARRALARALQAALEPRRRRSARPADPRIPPIGSVLRRRHGEREIEVRVVRGGFRFDGRVWPSLSAIARAVTGARWNGLLWFGLTGRSRDRRTREGAP